METRDCHIHTLKRWLLCKYVRYVLSNNLVLTNKSIYDSLQKHYIHICFSGTYGVEYEVFSDVAQGMGYPFPIAYSDNIAHKFIKWR